MMMLALLSLALPQNAFTGGDQALAATEPAGAIGVFQRVCLVPFADPQAFEAGVAKDPESFQRVDDAHVAPAPGTLRAHVEIWHSDKYNVRYAFPDNLPVEVPVPQCEVAARVAGPPDQQQIAGLVAASLKLQGAPVPIDGDPHRTRWDITGGGGKWRLFLETEAGSNGNFMSLHLINIRN